MGVQSVMLIWGGQVVLLVVFVAILLWFGNLPPIWAGGCNGGCGSVQNHFLKEGVRESSGSYGITVKKGDLFIEKKIITVLGAGPRLGNHIGREFGSKGFKAVLMARREDALKGYVTELESIGIDADYQVVDCADNASIKSCNMLVRNMEILICWYIMQQY